MTCKDCKHWSGYTEEWRDALGICSCTVFTHYESPKGFIHPIEKDSIYETGKNSSCIHWEAKE
jgi:hypothetical protein